MVCAGFNIVSADSIAEAIENVAFGEEVFDKSGMVDERLVEKINALIADDLGLLKLKPETKIWINCEGE